MAWWQLELANYKIQQIKKRYQIKSSKILIGDLQVQSENYNYIVKVNTIKICYTHQHHTKNYRTDNFFLPLHKIKVIVKKNLKKKEKRISFTIEM